MSTTTTIIRGDSGLVYRWNGSLTVNIYQGEQEVDVFTMGGADAGTYDELRESVERRELCLTGTHDVDDGAGYCSYCGEEIEK